MKVIGATGSSDKTTSEIDLGIAGLPSAVKDAIIEEAGEVIVAEILASLGEARSPVSGESFPRLSKKYREFKMREGGSGSPDLELYGDLKDALTWKPTENGLEVGFFGGQADKADGHNKLSGRENFTPQRRFLPAEGQNFKRHIVRQVEDIIDSHAGDAFKESDFGGVESSTELYDVLRGVYSGYTRSEIRQAVASSPELMDMLIGLNLLRYLV